MLVIKNTVKELGQSVKFLSKTYLGIIALSAVATAGPAAATPEWSCLQPALETELQNKLTYQDELAQRIIAERDDLADIAQLRATWSK